MQHILITGTNRGLGHQLVKQLLSYKNIEIYTTSRGSSQDLQKIWNQIGHQIKIHTYKLDIADNSSIDKFITQIHQEKIQFDFIVLNAAFGFDFMGKIPEVELAQKTLKTNVTGNIILMKNLIKYLSPQGRVVFPSSGLGALKYQSETIQKKFQNPQLTQNDIQNAINEYLECCKQKDLKGWSTSSYGTSKMLLNAWFRYILSKQLKESQSFVCMSPGHCKTDMGGPNAPRSCEYGASLINDCIWMKVIEKDKFYHTGVAETYMTCGMH